MGIWTNFNRNMEIKGGKMKSIILGLFAETFIHPGTGQSATAIDLPVAREAATDYPFIAGSSLKGALRDKARQIWPGSNEKDSDTVDDLFGKQENAGNILVSDARLLLLPVRSLNSSYRWLTCPHLLERLQRDSLRGGQALSFDIPSFKDISKPNPVSSSVAGLGTGSAESENKIYTKSQTETIFLEERNFKKVGEVDDEIKDALKKLIPNNLAKKRIDEQLAIVSDSDFLWFAKYGLAIQARNVLDTKTKASNNLWYEESLPPDTLMYTVLVERQADKLTTLVNKLGENPYIQAGGNETVGQGWFNIAIQGVE